MNAAANADRSWSQGFWSLMATQFQGAFSDNALKNLIIFLIMGSGISAERRDAMIPLVGALFAMPFILFSMLGGWLADRFSKRDISRGIKLFEAAIMLLAALALGLGSLALQLFAVFLMGVHSAIFGPSKYGLLPEILPVEKLSWGNGILELGTFVAIITGTMAGAFLSEHMAGMQYISGLVLMVLALAGYVASKGITPVRPANPGKPLQLNFLKDLWRELDYMRSDRALWLANWGNAWFFFLAALLQMNLFVHARQTLHLSDSQSGMLQAALAIGIGLGSALAGYASRGRIECRFIPLGTAGLVLAASLLSWRGVPVSTFGLFLALLGFAGGFFIVPVSAVLQHNPAPDRKGGVLAAANLLSFLGIFLASGVDFLFASVMKLTTAQIFMACSAMAAVTLLFIIRDGGSFSGRRQAASPIACLDLPVRNPLPTVCGD